MGGISFKKKDAGNREVSERVLTGRASMALLYPGGPGRGKKPINLGSLQTHITPGRIRDNAGHRIRSATSANTEIRSEDLLKSSSDCKRVC